MTAVSSFRPFGQNTEFDANAVKAKESWNRAFDTVYYLNAPEPRLETGNTWFVGNDEYPTIKSLCEWCASQEGWACIVNADIVVSPMLKQVVDRAAKVFAWALVSYRWQPKNGSFAVTDNGLDFFAALPWLWAKVRDAVPKTLRIGHPTWDTWMIGYFNRHARHHFYDITAYRCVFHPIHGGRQHPCQVDDVLANLKGFYGMPPQLQ